jgi:hypothetical protein
MPMPWKVCRLLLNTEKIRYINVFMRDPFRLYAAFVFMLFLGVSRVYAQDSSPADTDNLVFKVVIFGPSDKIFIWWGHAALIVENTRWNYSRVFDWGIFSYPSDNFLWDFVHDRVRYRCRAGPMDLSEYYNEDRDIAVYTLDLEPEGKQAILTYAENKVLPENCYYDYHEFRNNCSTGIRDVIDMGTLGQLKAVTEKTPGRFSLRQHVRRFSWHNPVADWVLDLLLGQTHDRAVNVWDEMFLPAEIARVISGFSYTGASGTERKLVSSAQILNSTKTRHPFLNVPLPQWLGSLTLGALAAAALSYIKTLRRKYPLPGRIAWGISQSAAGLLFGAAGCVLFFARFFLNNDYVRQNINLLFVNPLLLAALPLGILVAQDRLRRIQPERCLRILWTYVFIAGGASTLVKALPFFYQQNLSVAALVLPVAFVSGYGPEIFRRLARRTLLLFR